MSLVFFFLGGSAPQTPRIFLETPYLHRNLLDKIQNCLLTYEFYGILPQIIFYFAILFVFRGISQIDWMFFKDLSEEEQKKHKRSVLDKIRCSILRNV